jgi:hypothetical protein
MIQNDIIDIQDKFLIDDDHSRVRGFVAAYNENGERIFLKENMIVISGRKKILEYLRHEPRTGDTPFFEGMQAFLDTSTSVTTPAMTFNSIRGSLGGLSHEGLSAIKEAMNSQPVLIESIVNNEEAYTKVFTHGDFYYVDNVVDDGVHITTLTKATQIEHGKYYYTLRELTNSETSFPKTALYFVYNESVSPKRYEKTLQPQSELANNRVFIAEPSQSAMFNSEKSYYINNGTDYVLSDTGYFDVEEDYYIKNIKSDIDFELVECFKITYDASLGNRNGQTRFGSLGLYFPGDDEDDEFADAVLFSRVTFPPYSARSNLKFFYYLYF